MIAATQRLSMRLIGYWMNDLRQEHLCLPQEVVSPLPADVRRKLVTYLRGGRPFRFYRGYSWCRFFCGCDSSFMGTTELTDGEWAWPEGLPHYVEEHGITLPEEFVQHAVRLETPPAIARPIAPAFHSESVTTASHEIQASLHYWSAWCQTHRSGPVRERLREAKEEADKVVASTFQQWCEEDIARYGLADHGCRVPECGRKAVGGKKLCCVHRIDSSSFKQATERCYEIRPEHVFTRGAIGNRSTSCGGGLQDA